MTEQDLQDLREFQKELVASELSRWEPRCVARAFQTLAENPFVLTMQAWMDLEAVQSPFLLGQMPEAEEAIEVFRLAFAAFGYRETTPEACEPDELLLLGNRMKAAIEEAFAMRLSLEAPAGFQKGSLEDNGLGNWLPVMAGLIGQLHLSMAEARALPVGQAFALLGSHRCNEGWTVAGDKYTWRDSDAG